MEGMAGTSTETHTSVQTDGSGLFVRNATGLVREMSQRDNLILAALAGAPAAFVALTIFFVLSGLPGGNIYVAGLLDIPLILAFSYAFGLMSAAIPRSGGDYTIVSRILTPGLGLISTFCMVFGGFALSGAFLGKLFSQLGIAPALQTVGLVAGSHTLFDWGTTVAASKGWQFAFGVLMFAIGAAVHLGGPRWARRALAVGFFGSSAGLLVAMLIGLFTSQHGFAHHFNAFAQPFTHSADTYSDTIRTAQKAGVNTSPGFSMAATIPVIGVFATSSIYTWFASFAAGELRQASSLRTANRMALGGVVSVAMVIVACLILFHSWGVRFITAAFGGGFPASLGAGNGYFSLTSFQLGNTIFAFLICLSFLLVFPMFATQGYLGLTRVLFAWSFDGLLPAKVATVSGRTNAPVNAIFLATVIYVITLAWAVFVSHSLIQVIVYTTVIGLVPMMLVGVAAAVFPYRRPELFRASGVTQRVAGVPIVVIAGISALLAGAFVIWLYFHYPFFGLADKGRFFLWCGGTIGVALIYYAIVRAVRARQGVDMKLVYAEIPPE